MMNMTVRYPSGKTMKIQGKYKGRVLVPDTGYTLLIETEGQSNLFDPRAVILNETGAILHNPRDWGTTGSVDLDGWMADHPEWP